MIASARSAAARRSRGRRTTRPPQPHAERDYSQPHQGFLPGINVGGWWHHGGMEAFRDALEQVRSVLLAASEAAAPARCSDDELLHAMRDLESLGRVVDARRLEYAGEVAERSRRELGGERLSARMGCRSASELVERVTQVSGGEARRRVAVGAATRARVGFSGERCRCGVPDRLDLAEVRRARGGCGIRHRSRAGPRAHRG